MKKRGATFWLTGMPSSGKTTLSLEIVREISLIHLDSDVIREILTPHPSYSQAEREIIYRSIIYFCRVLNDNGHNVIVSATANLKRYRILAEQMLPNYHEIYIKCPLEICEKRDVKDLYKLSREGKISTVPLKIFGENDKYVEKYYNKVDVYEEPENPRLILDTYNQDKKRCCEILKNYIKECV